MRKPSRSRQSVARWCNRAVRCGGLAGLLLVLMVVTPAAAVTISTDFTQNGGLFNNGSGALVVSHVSNDPLLTITNGATTTEIPTTVIGSLTNEEGRLLIDGGGIVTSAGPGQWTTFGSFSIYNGSYLGLNTNATGRVTVRGLGSKWIIKNGLNLGWSGTGILDVEDGGYVSDVGMDIGAFNTGELNIMNGGMVSSILAPTVAYGVNSIGTATVNGSGSKWTISSSLYVGNAGSGSFKIENGGNVANTHGYLGYNANSNGTAIVTGAGSTWNNSGSLYVGSSGAGTLHIENGASVSNVSGYLGYNANSSGTAIVTGGGSKWTNADLYVGRSGAGTLNIENGGNVSSYNGVLGVSTNSSGLAKVAGAGSKWTIGDLLSVGTQGFGELRVENGGVVDSARTYVGSNLGVEGKVMVAGPGSTWTTGYAQFRNGSSLDITSGGTFYSTGSSLDGGTTSSATVTGANSKWINSGQLYVGEYGTGNLKIDSGGTVSNGWDSYLGYNANSTGTATVSGAGSDWINSQALYIGYGGTGSLKVENGGSVSAQTLFAPLYSLYGNGEISVNGAVLDGVNLLFDAAHGSQPTIPFGSGGQLHLNLDGTGALGAGYNGVGSLTISDGVTVLASGGYLGYRPLSNGTATVTGAGSKWTNQGNLVVGFDGIGQLNIENGGAVSNASGYLGFSYKSSSGIVTVTGEGSKWTNYESLYVGYDCTGTLIVENGGNLSAQTLFAPLSSLHGNGEISANGAVLDDVNLVFDAMHGSQQTIPFGSGGQLHLNLDGSGALGAGHKGVGTLTISGGVAISSSEGFLGYRNDSNGAATVSGLGSKWINTGGLYVGGNGGYEGAGTGTLIVADGAAVSNVDGWIGLGSGNGVATVTGAGSKWINSGSLSIGDEGAGILNIELGGRVEIGGSMSIGELYGEGVLNIRQGGSLSIGEFFSIGYYTYDAKARIENGGIVSDRVGSVGIGSSGAEVVITGAGSKWINGESLRIDEGRVSVNDGGLVIVNGAAGVTIDSDGTLAGSGGTVQAHVTNKGNVAPGASLGILTIAGNYTQQSTGKLIFELGGVMATSAYDRLVITGDAALGGTLQVLLINGFTPSPGQSFDLLDWSSVNSTFNSLQLPALPDGLSWNTSRLYTTGVLSVTIPGDFDTDGDVDGADFVAWQTSFPRASGATPVQGDSDGDGDVDGADFVAWQTHFPFSPSPGAAPVPEPKAGVLLLTAGVGLTIAAFRRSMKSTTQLVG